MANPEHVDILGQGVARWNEWRKDKDGSSLDLSSADLRNRDLTGADLRAVNLSNAILRNAKLGKGTRLWNANLSGADLYDADLHGADLQDVNISGAVLRESNLNGADLSKAKGLLSKQLAGSDLTRATLPERLAKPYESLSSAKEISDSSKKLFFWLLAGCISSWLTIAQTTDVGLITNRAFTPLPMIQTSIPIVGFYVVEPLILLFLYLYFHFYLQKFWEELGSLPAVFTDGRLLHNCTDPWLMNDFVRAHFTKLNKGRPFLSYFQAWVSTLLAWWLVPITLFLFWGRYMRRHELFWTICHAFLLAVAIISAVRLYRIAGETLRGNERESFSWKDVISRRSTYVRLAFATTLIAVLVVISVSAIYGSANSSMSRMMEAAGYSLFANINNADVCIKPPNWTGKSVAELDLVTGANLAWKDLRHAHGYQSFFVHANLEGSQMEESSLVFADFRRASARGIHLDDALMLSSRLNEADLTVASMKRANLSKASLVSSELSQAHLENAKFSETDLTAARLVGSNLTSAIFDKTIIKYADFRGAQGLTRDAIKNGCIDWQHAYFSPDMLTQLDLSSDHNEKLEREMEAELLATAFATAVPANSKP